MSSARFHEGIAPASDTVVRFDAPWGRRVGNDLKPDSRFSIGALNRRLATVRRALPIQEGEIASTFLTSLYAFKAARIAVGRIPAQHGLPPDAWIEVGAEIGKAYPLHQTKYRNLQRAEHGSMKIPEHELELVVDDIDKALSASATTEYVRGGASMLLQWLHLAELVQLPGDVHETTLHQFLSPSIPEVQYAMYSGVQEQNR